MDATARTLFYELLLADYSQHPRTFVISTHLIDEMENLFEDIVLLAGLLAREWATNQCPVAHSSSQHMIPV